MNSPAPRMGASASAGGQLLALGLAGPLLLAACAAGTQVEPVATNTVDLPPSYRFEPAAITVPAGTMVTWTNNDNFTHNVQLAEESEPLLMRPGESVSYTFATAGEYEYICSLHPTDMRGTVVVSGP